jgi:hypothetical protein
MAKLNNNLHGLDKDRASVRLDVPVVPGDDVREVVADPVEKLC